MAGIWEPYASTSGSTVVGDLLVHRTLDRELLALLPPGYGSGERYPVLYAHDGQNLFDAATSNDGEWSIDETMAELADEGIEAIVVGIPNAGDTRAFEYSPWPNPPYLTRGGADEYLDFVLGSVKPLVDASFRVSRHASATGILGSSLGAQVSLYAFLSRPGVFGFAGVLSPAIFGGEAAFAFFEQAPFAEGKIWLDVGDREEPDDPAMSAWYVEEFNRLASILVRKGYGPDRLRATVAAGARHHESAWAIRFPDAMRFWLGG